MRCLCLHVFAFAHGRRECRIARFSHLSPRFHAPCSMIHEHGALFLSALQPWPFQTGMFESIQYPTWRTAWIAWRTRALERSRYSTDRQLYSSRLSLPTILDLLMPL
ncbi:hypothetical protein CC85DRAFT_7900 [Cutaneotrichosporon oleaginosum]|uniref:Uncharacterized protein n=1 Tax=Cutaneotrichosporon oleaginosum TaxID=879819 RepID=A0A0J1B9J6_9TREE|nr:uncharacterized protein CC85DRAFT_7900 [Cutaneotrichosporon oleaginosum]KLT44514.1 hypothetical protein CC85DRAFT_7900 [Cutaneotrichosporon oleaginosum]TXT13969.1 hypothetical protein COLE_00162 [Cutaneotrichosporon oleaginosum]